MAEMTCRKCGSSNVDPEWREDRQQYATRCGDCQAFTWQPKDPENKYRRESKHLDLVKKKGLDYCEICLRKKDEIPPPGTLEAHHIVEYKDGGSDNLENILIACTACHKLIHHQRTYLGHYTKSNTL